MLALDFLSGKHRAAFATQGEAVAAAREAWQGDLRPRAVWLCRGGAADGVVVPDRYVVGVARRGQQEPGQRVELVGSA